MKTVSAILTILALFSTQVFGDSPSVIFSAIGYEGRVALRLFGEPCTNLKVFEHIKPEFVSRFKKSVLTWKGKDWESCWIAIGGIVYSIDEEGAQFQPVPLEAFKSEVL